MADDKLSLLLEYNLQFFAKDGPGGEKTEPASQKKLDDARKDGKVAKSKELVSSFSLLALFLLIKFYSPYLGESFVGIFKSVYTVIPDMVSESMTGFTTNNAIDMVLYGIKNITLLLLPVLIVAFVIAFVFNVIQVKFKATAKPLKPKLDKINPLNGFKRMFSVSTLVEFIKNMAMMGVIVYLSYSTLRDKTSYLFGLYDITLNEAISAIGGLVVELGIKISVVFVIIGFADFIYQKFKFKNDMMMTKQEVKDEYKQTEGDPQVKGQRKQKMREASRRRMMNNLPSADVVITNPTHFAVALKYDSNEAKAPVVIAKGADYLAAAIKEKAREYDVSIVENRPLARMLYNNVDIGEEIPEELYQSVAEVLAMVYSLNGKQ